MKHYASIYYPSKSYCKSSSKDITTSSKNVTCPRCLELLAKQARRSEYELGDYDIKDDMIGTARRTIVKPQNERVSIRLLKTLIREALERSEIDSFIQKMEDNGWTFVSTARQITNGTYTFESNEPFAIAKISYFNNRLRFVGYKLTKTSFFNALKADDLDSAYDVINARREITRARKNKHVDTTIFGEGTSWILKADESRLGQGQFLVYEDENLQHISDVFDVDSFMVVMGPVKDNGALPVEFNQFPSYVKLSDLKPARLKASRGPRKNLKPENESKHDLSFWYLTDRYEDVVVDDDLAENVIIALNNEFKNDYRFRLPNEGDPNYVLISPLKFHTLSERDNVLNKIKQIVAKVLEQDGFKLQNIQITLYSRSTMIDYLS